MGDKAADPSCAGKTDGWCVDSWCYVDPCNCKTDTPKKSSYFPNLETSSGDPAYYSYETCGSADSFTGSAADLSKVACPLIKDEAKCGARSDCGWADTGRCLGIEYLNACPDSIDDHEDCSCIDASHIDASDEPKYPFYEAGNVDYPAAVGSFCKAWDKTADPGCDGATDGWCLDAWCYVDPCTCKHGIPVASGYFPNLKTDTGDRLFYSYQTCGLDKDKYSCEATDPESVANQGCPCNSDQRSWLVAAWPTRPRLQSQIQHAYVSLLQTLILPRKLTTLTTALMVITQLLLAHHAVLGTQLRRPVLVRTQPLGAHRHGVMWTHVPVV